MLSFLSIAYLAKSQCDKIYVDIEKGTMNGLGPKASQAEVKAKFPCFTGNSPDGSKENCGGGVFCNTHDFYFYTGDDFINIRKDFTGTCSIELLGKTEEQAMKLLGKSEGEIKDNEGVRYIFFKRKYGCLIIQIDDAGKVGEFFIYAKEPEVIDICA